MIIIGASARQRRLWPSCTRRASGRYQSRAVAQVVWWGAYRDGTVARYSSFAPESFTTFAHFGISARMIAASCSGVLPTMSKPRSVNFARISG
jgi:hypothetical protein